MKRSRKFLVFFTLMMGLLSCSRLEKSKSVYVSGQVLDQLTSQGLADIDIQIDAVKSAANGLSSFAKRRTVGRLRTDGQGNFLGMLTIFADAEFLNYRVNYEGSSSFKSHDARPFNQYLSGLQRNQCPPMQMRLGPLTKLRIEILNNPPKQDADTFSLVIPGRIIYTENYSGVQPTGLDRWVGKNVWAAYYTEARAEDWIFLYSKCSTNGSVIFQVDSIYTRRDTLNSIQIAY